MIRMPQSEREFISLLMDATELGAKKALIDADLLRPYIKMSAAHRKYGESTVERWFQEGLIDLIQDGPRIQLQD